MKQKFIPPNKFTKQDFINKSKIHHGDFYNYDKSDYKNQKTKVIITCPEHGDFEQLPSNHMAGAGCKKCGIIRAAAKPHIQKTTESFIKEANVAHDNFYDYSLFKYDGHRIKSTVICPIHGKFSIDPDSHISSKSGCKSCADERRKKSMIYDAEKWVDVAKSIHGEKFDYSNLVYLGSKEKVEIICPIHGSFWQKPNTHITGKGCPDCGHLNRSSFGRKSFIKKYEGKEVLLYVIRGFSEYEEFIKVGITGADVKRRSPCQEKYKYEILYEIKNDATTIWDLEKHIHKEITNFRYDPKIQFYGHTECFTMESLAKIDLILNIF